MPEIITPSAPGRKRVKRVITVHMVWLFPTPQIRYTSRLPEIIAPAALRKPLTLLQEPSAGDKESVIALLVEARFMRGARNEPKRKENKA